MWSMPHEKKQVLRKAKEEERQPDRIVEQIEDAQYKERD